MADQAPGAAPDSDNEFGNIPVERWITHPVSDSSDYLDRPTPAYEGHPDPDLDDEDLEDDDETAGPDDSETGDE